ncbi:MAG: biotin--[acetyl-CoA-carboxylase] ligase [Epsilonproteobacteria bacterium]|nr:biotin--[acetyl-CoA-carboxylase] ligase [Campylobacterota bacterium]
MEIIYFDTLDSTQKYLIDAISSGSIEPPVAVLAKNQTNGIGSRDNSWEGGCGNLFISFALNIKSLPEDLPISSASIYFSYLMRERLSKYVDGIFVKWPNDIYIGRSKVGGVVTKMIGNLLICGIGVNLRVGSNSFSSLNLNVEPEEIVKLFLKELEKRPSWSEIFHKYSVDFEQNRGIFANIDGERVELGSAILDSDGSIILGGKRVYSLR